MKTPNPLAGSTAVLFAALFWLGSSAPASAHGGEAIADATAFSTWNLTPEIVILTILTLWVYLRGIARRRLTANPPSLVRHGLFFAGLGFVFLALQSPLDPIAERLFSVHQVQHLLIRMVGPMLLTLSAPEAVLIAGLPRVLRHRALKPVLQNTVLRRVFSAISRPVPAFVIFVASLYVWQVPAIHNAAILNPMIHYTMHVTMLLAGMLFWWMIFDRRDPPAAPSRPFRAYLLLATIVSNILLGSLTTLKVVVLYTAYDVHGRLFGISPLVDESFGGYTIWVPPSMMTIIAILIVISGWARQEERHFSRRHLWASSNSAALDYPVTAEELRIKVKGPNLTAGLTLAATSATMFVIAVSTVVALTVLY